MSEQNRKTESAQEVKNRLRAFIPRKISNRAVIGFLELSRIIGRPFTVKRAKRSETNARRTEEHLKGTGITDGYIEDQNSYTDVVYGSKTMQYSGCGVFAVYNALHDLYRKEEAVKQTGDQAENPAVDKVKVLQLDALIREFESNGIVFSGNLGTAPCTIMNYFRRKGYDTQISYRTDEFDRIGDRSDTLILTMYNDRSDIMRNVHTICISKRGNSFQAHNTYCDGSISPVCRSVSEVVSSINHGRAGGICLIGIRRVI